MTLRVVLDTHVVLSALLFPHGRLTWIRHAWTRRDFLPLVSGATTRELIRVLTYPKFELTADEIEVLLSDYLPFAEVVAVEGFEGEGVPDPPDPDDRIFLELAAAGEATHLATGDRALQNAPAPDGVDIVSPATFGGVLEDE